MSDPATWVVAAPFLALAGALVNGLFGRRMKEPVPGIVGTAVAILAFAASLATFVALLGRDDRTIAVRGWTFLTAGDLTLTVGAVVDPLSSLMMLVITGVGALIHLYSIGYMHGDAGYARYFALLNLFVAAMSVLVLADSYPLVFVGWEGVGVASFLLIGFWYQTKANADAARKAFIVNRIGDVGFLVGTFLVVATFGTANIASVNEAAARSAFGSDVLAWIGIAFLIAAAGKSAQLPLHVWLPDAMAGPTPVSALIHAATMVTAGVYLIARSGPMYAMTPLASAVVAWVGVATAIVAAVAALAQTDVKKILAYSTVSQLGFMFVAVGAGAYWVGIFHVFTHAFFKALLFLGAGSVIHALGGEQDVRRMGGLRSHMPVTAATSLVATLAIAGVPFLAGFFSKDAILAFTLASNQLDGYGTGALYALLLATAVLTAFYMFRWWYQIFAGPSRLSEAAAAHVHESPRVMTVPLVILAVFSVGAGYLGLPEFAFPNWIAHWLEPAILGDLTYVPFDHPPVWVEWTLVAVSVAAAALGLSAAWWVYAVRGGAPVATLAASPFAGAAQRGLGFDAAYRVGIVGPAEGTAAAVVVLDRDVVTRGVASIAPLVRRLARSFVKMQTGYVRAYALAMFAGTALLLLAVAWWGVRA